jgi:tetratricopeptide (TPR) repeat protein/GGDEF domain-containing protein
MPDVDKLYEKADKYLQRQKFEAAIETYQEILRYEPNDEEALINLGDLCAKMNRMAEALRYQVQLADYYIRRSDNAKAIATCRKVLKLSPQDVVTLMKLASLLEKSQKNTEALEAYREALGNYRRAGLNSQMLDCLTRIIKLDPNNLEENLELAELATRSRQNKVAMPALLRAAQLARRAGDESRWEKLVDQAHTLDPADEVASIYATEIYVKRGNFAEAAKLIVPLLAKRTDDLEVLELACRAFLGVGNYTQAQPLCWKLYQAKPERVDLVLKLVEGLIQSGAVEQLLGTVNQLKERLFQQGKRNEFLKIIEKVYETDESNLDVLELLSNLYNEMNKEDGLRRSLSRLFNLYLAGENYRKAGDTLERILDVDPYGEGHYDRLVNLEGHIDPTWYKNILARAQPPSSGRTSPAANAAASATQKTESLEDLLVEGEMYHQYQLSAKLEETVGKIDRLYPGADEKNQRVRELYDAAHYTPKFKAPAAAAVAAAPRADATSPGVGSFQSLDDLRKISEITANIYRESTPQGVLQVAVNEIGRAMNASRCWGAVGVPDQPPVLTAEYCSPLASPSDPVAALKLFAFLMAQATSSPDGWSLENAAQAPLLSPVIAEIQKLGIRSLQALPLIDKDAAAGLVLLEQCEAQRTWSPGESMLLRATSTQVVIAINNTKLRRLVRSLAGTDPETGLLPRSAYLECLLSEARRSKDQSQPLAVCLLEPENPHALLKTLGDAGVQRFVLQVGKALTPALRQNDISIRYSPLSIVVVFPDTALPQAGLAVEKVRRALAQIRVNGAEATNFCAVVCDVPLGTNFDAVDGVTEVINRLEVSLDRAHKEGGKRILISKFAG